MSTKMILETIQVARHMGGLVLRPLRKGAVQVAKTSEELVYWGFRTRHVEDVLGRERSRQMWDSYLQAKDVVCDSVASLGHLSWKSGLQTCAQGATMALRHTGFRARVIGPEDEHWNTLKVLRDLRAEHAEHLEGDSFRLTPKRFVKIMRDAERRKRRTRGRDPIEGYVQHMLSSGSLRRLGPMVLEKQLYTDVARLLCFAFDRTLMMANGAQIWGHDLRVNVVKEESTTYGIARRTVVCLDQVEAIVDRMLESEDLAVPVLMQSVHKQLIVNCAFMMLQLFEDITSDQNMRASMLGHRLLIKVEPSPLIELVKGAGDLKRHQFHVNSKAIDELVEALIDDPELQHVYVPDILEAEVYRFALHRTVCIMQFILAQLRVTLFGLEVELGLVVGDEGKKRREEKETDQGGHEVLVTRSELQGVLKRLEDERFRIKKELRSRIAENVALASAKSSVTTTADTVSEVAALGMGEPHEFETMAAQDRLSRCLSIRRSVPFPIHVAFRLVSGFEDYPRWMPLCTSARVLGTDSPQRMRCEVGFGLNTGTVLGVVGDCVTYQVHLMEPRERQLTSVSDPEELSLRVARVVADTTDGFAYGKRLVYDWRFAELPNGETDVRLDMFFQAKSFFFLPLWDSMQAAITGVMMKKFIERAGFLSGTGAVHESRST